MFSFYEEYLNLYEFSQIKKEVKLKRDSEEGLY